MSKGKYKPPKGSVYEALGKKMILPARVWDFDLIGPGDLEDQCELILYLTEENHTKDGPGKKQRYEIKFEITDVIPTPLNPLGKAA